MHISKEKCKQLNSTSCYTIAAEQQQQQQQQQKGLFPGKRVFKQIQYCCELVS